VGLIYVIAKEMAGEVNIFLSTLLNKLFKADSISKRDM
jgi:hypothetical protein